MHCCCCEHRHKIKCRICCCDDHNHKIKDYTCCADNVCYHTHILEGCTTSKDGHRHYYCLETGPAIPLDCGGHCHYIDGEVDCSCDHIHDVCIEVQDEKTDLY